jgi:hypothetical protein
MTVAQATDHVERGLSRLIDQYKDKPRLGAWISSYLNEVQALSDATWSVLVSRLINDATSEQLTVLGRLVGQERQEESDDRFRVLVRARIAINGSRGRGDDVLRVAALLFALEFTLTEFFPGAMVLQVDEPVGAIPELEQSLLEQTAASGVRVDVHFSTESPGDWFRFGAGSGWGVDHWIGAVS